MKNKEKLSKRIKNALEIDELAMDTDLVEMRGQSDLTVRGCKRILHYGEEAISLSMNKYILKICGIGLYLASFNNGAVRVSGEIASLEFEARRSKK